MKKISTIIFPLTLLAFVTCFPKNYQKTLAQDTPKQLEQTLKVGDLMPEPKGRLLEPPLKNEDIEYRVYVNEMGFPSEVEAYKVCNKMAMKKPFAIHLFETDTSYVDNKNKKGEHFSDRSIDEIVKIEKGQKYITDLPQCATEI